MDGYDPYDRKRRKNKGGGGGGVGGCSPAAIALTAMSILGLVAGLVTSSVTFATSIQSLQTQINNMNALMPNMTTVSMPCYGPNNTPAVPSQMECVGDGVTTPAQNCDLTYFALPGGDVNGPGICGVMFVTRMGHNMSVTIGVAGSLYYANNTNNTNSPFNPALPFVSVTTKIRWNDMIPVGYRPPASLSVTATMEYSLPQLMLASIGQIFFNADGSIEMGIGFGDTVPGPEEHAGFNVAVTFITYMLQV